MSELPDADVTLDALPSDHLKMTASWEQERLFDVVVVGAGIAGLAFALRLPEQTRLALVTKGALGESNTRYAQGGLAAAVGEDDEPALHYEDTLIAGAGLCDPEAVRILVEQGPAAVDWLLAQGTAFDRDAASRLELGREGAHSRNRVLHAGGDATGFEIERALVARIRERHIATIFEHATALDLLVQDGRCAGIVMDHADTRFALRAGVTVLANGGCGQLWSVTSNPPAATGDGVAMAIRAGVTVADLEFTQFHPTVLALPGGAPFLISEAVRGEGAYLRNRAGERFMVGQHPLAELAPRDVVARAIQAQMVPDGQPSVWLDLRHLDPAEMERRFPTIARHLAAQGLSLTRDLLPVAPAAHYFMGGIDAGTDGTTSLPGLLAIGEVSCTGVHGANRLASNSLLEGLVFGLSAADRLDSVAPPATGISPARDGHRLPALPDEETHALRTELQAIMSRDVSVVRDHASLDDAEHRLREIAERIAGRAIRSVPAIELRNMALLALAMTISARNRRESRGGHYRSDYPATDPALDGMHQFVLPGNRRVFRSLAIGRQVADTAVVP
jgi:L-aspartate oxidase